VVQLVLQLGQVLLVGFVLVQVFQCNVGSLLALVVVGSQVIDFFLEAVELVPLVQKHLLVGYQNITVGSHVDSVSTYLASISDYKSAKILDLEFYFLLIKFSLDVHLLHPLLHFFNFLVLELVSSIILGDASIS
jgi:hypothetical protein